MNTQEVVNDIVDYDVDLVGDSVARYTLDSTSKTQQYAHHLSEENTYAVLHETMYQLLTEDNVEQVDVVHDDTVTSIMPKDDELDTPEEAATVITDYLQHRLDQTPKYVR